MNPNPLSGVFVAAVTPLTSDFAVDQAAIVPLLDFYAKRGAHGALLFGTTGEGPSFSPEERIAAAKIALQVKQAHPNFKLLLGTGTPSLSETINLTHAAFDLGMDGVMALPPYYFKNASDEGLFVWFSNVIKNAVPAKGAFFVYHIPSVSGVAVSPDLLARLKDAFPDEFQGLKDSSADAAYGQMLGERFGHDLHIFCGTDQLFQNALKAGASACITAAANLASPDLRRVYDAFLNGTTDAEAQKRLETIRAILAKYPPNPSSLKAMLARAHNFAFSPVRPPLLSLTREVEDKEYAEMKAAGLI
jgi:4-hydroxy-tetrahydrodipicolinate synthase